METETGNGTARVTSSYKSVVAISGLRSHLARLESLVIEGRVSAVGGMAAEIDGLAGYATIGTRLTLAAHNGSVTAAEIVSVRQGRACAMAFGSLDGVGPGASARLDLQRGTEAVLCPSATWLGRVIDPLGSPLDGLGPLTPGRPRAVRTPPPAAVGRGRLGPRLSLGVRALDLFTTCRTGQRLGVFAGSGVGKSTLLSMLAQQAQCDVAVIALVGERGREVREFIEAELGETGLARSVVIVATSDQPPLLRREAAYAAMTVAEHFRDQGQSVLLMMDSVTRFCLALREIALAGGEPPATRGYPPSVFAELPCLLERAGPGTDAGAQTGYITGLFTVLVEGDDMNEPIADAVRGILDGHVVLDRAIAEGGRYPAVDVLRSLSRTVPHCLPAHEAALARTARAALATAAELSDLVRLGAYVAGADPAADTALRLAPQILNLLHQGQSEPATLDNAFAALDGILRTADAA